MWIEKRADRQKKFWGAEESDDEGTDEMIALKHSALFIRTRLVMWIKVLGWKLRDLGSSSGWDISGCATLGKSLIFPESQFPFWQNEWVGGSGL